MAKRGWIPDLPDLTDRAEELIGGLIRRAGGFAIAAAPLYRKNDNRRVAQLSPHEDGPLRARDFLREHGIGKVRRQLNSTV